MPSKLAMQLVEDLFQVNQIAEAKGRVIDHTLDDLYDRLAVWMSNRCLLYAGHGPENHAETCRKALTKFREHLEEHPRIYPLDETGPPQWALDAADQLFRRNWEGHRLSCICKSCESSRAQLIAEHADKARAPDTNTLSCIGKILYRILAEGGPDGKHAAQILAEEIEQRDERLAKWIATHDMAPAHPKYIARLIEGFREHEQTQLVSADTKYLEWIKISATCWESGHYQIDKCSTMDRQELYKLQIYKGAGLTIYKCFKTLGEAKDYAQDHMGTHRL